MADKIATRQSYGEALAELGNKYENLDFYDIRNDIHYKNEEGKDKDCEPNEEGEFPAVKGSIIRPRDEREY